MDGGMIQLRQGDCLELMRGIPDGSVDMVLCDLPYGTTRNRWDTVIPFGPLWEQYHRIVRPDGAVCLFAQMPFAAALVMSNPREFRYEWVWQKSNKTGFLNAKRRPLKEHESILVFSRRTPVYHPQMVSGKNHARARGEGSANYGRYHSALSHSIEYYPGDIISFKCIFHTHESQYHPTQKPVALLEYLIKTYTEAGETVLDNCMGSGSAGVACVHTGRRFVGIELEPEYFAVAENRIGAARQQIRIEEEA